jgi:hypothetical protein
MKKIKLLTAGLLAISVAGTASAATTVIRITGSTAFRKTTYNAIVSSLNSPVGAVIGTGGASDMTGDAQAVFSGTLNSGPKMGTAVVFETAFGGSTGGLQVVTQGLTTIPGAFTNPAQVWLSPTTNTLTSVTIGAGGAITGANALTSPNYDSASTADVTMADTFQAATPWTHPSVASQPSIGAVVYFWTKGLQESPDIPNASYAAFTNMTTQQAGLLLSDGELPLSLFTGNASDASYIVCLDGRNNDSGTRSTVQAETSLGTADIQIEDMFQNTTPGSSPITSITEVGDVGYNSGGKLATDLKTPIQTGTTDPNFGLPFILVGYLGTPDAATAVAGGAVRLTYNGVDGTVTQNVANGNYSYWNYEHIDATAAAAADPIKGPTITVLQANEVSLAGLNGLILSALNVSRASDGAPVAPL